MHLYNQQAQQWIDQCLAVPAEADPPEQPDPPEYTDDLPSTPGICLVDAGCEGGGPYFRICLCEGQDDIDCQNCTDSSALNDQELEQLNEALGRPCRR